MWSINLPLVIPLFQSATTIPDRSDVAQFQDKLSKMILYQYQLHCLFLFFSWNTLQWKINCGLCFESTKGHRWPGWLRMWCGDHRQLQQWPAFPQASNSSRVWLFQVLHGNKALHVDKELHAHSWTWPSLSLRWLLLQVNLNKACPFWTSESHCGIRDCAVKPCSPVGDSSSSVNQPCRFFFYPLISKRSPLTFHRVRCQKASERPTTIGWVPKSSLLKELHQR